MIAMVELTHLYYLEGIGNLTILALKCRKDCYKFKDLLHLFIIYRL